MFVHARFFVAMPSGLEFHWQGGSVESRILQAHYQWRCAHAVPSWIDTFFYSVSTISSRFPLLPTSSLPFTPWSTQCRIIMTTKSPHRTTHWTILLQPLPIILSLPPVHPKASRRPVADGLTMKSCSSLTMLNQIALWQWREALPWRNLNSTRLVPL